MLSFRFSGVFLSRFADRRFLGSFQAEPPRSARQTTASFFRTCQVLLCHIRRPLPTPQLPADAVGAFQGEQYLLLIEEPDATRQPQLQAQRQ